MAKYRPYSNREFRRLFGSWIRRNLRRILALIAGALALVALETLILLVAFPRTALTWWLMGVIQTIVVAALLHLMHASFLAHDREAIRHLRGAWGEENTRSELQLARRKKLIWDWVDSISLRAGDIDHLVVTRHGGLVAIDSKWRNQANDTLDMAVAANKARLRAEGLAQTLLKRDRDARHRSRTNPLKVTPVVVLWGTAQSEVPESARVEGIEFVAGRNLLEWLAGRDGEPVNKAAARDVVKQFEEFRAAAWDNTKRPSH